MEDLASSLNFVLEIRLKIESGNSLRNAIKEYLACSSRCPFHKEVTTWFVSLERGASSTEAMSEVKNPYRRVLFSTLSQGLKGEPVTQRLDELEKEMINVAHDDIERHLQRLPIIALMPLLLLQFPAFMMLLLGPLLMTFLEQVNHL